MKNLTRILLDKQDLTYKAFSEKLVPDTKYPIIGVRVPKIKELAKQISKNDLHAANEFLSEKHTNYEEFMLHAFLIGYVAKDLQLAFDKLEEFLPYLDNWAICDSLVTSLKIFKKHTREVFEKVRIWLKDKNPYTIRFGVVTLLSYFLGDNFCEQVLTLAKNVCCEHYYVNMAVAWLFSVALIKNYDETICHLKSNTLPKFVHNKAIQKAIESYRISDIKKEYLRTLKIK